MNKQQVAAADTQWSVPKKSVDLNRLCAKKSLVPLLGEFTFFNSLIIDSIQVAITQKNIKNVLYRQIVFEGKQFLDTFYFRHSNPRYALASETSKVEFIFFGEEVGRFNTGRSLDLSYDLKYISMLKSIDSCNEGELFHYYLDDVGVLTGTKAPPVMISEMYLDSAFNVVGMALSNEKDIFYRE